jgi:dTDP-4-dehydrorhamnose 3,5-epimerase
MKLTETPLAGAFVVDIEQHRDDRGFFGRSFCVDEFQGAGIQLKIAQCNVSFNHRRGTLRGMHFQIPPNAEAKLVRCTRGAIYDVIVDLRPESPTYTHHFAVELTATNHRSLYVPPGFAHGFQTLEDDAEVFYQMSEAYSPAHERGLRWNDPALAIQWPLPPMVISPKDENYDDFAG